MRILLVPIAFVVSLLLASCSGKTVVDSPSGAAADSGETGVSAPDAPASLVSDFVPPSGKTTGPGDLGPWSNRLMTAFSSDGLTFTRSNLVVSDQADVPDLVIDKSGKIFLYYLGWTVGDDHNKVVVAISSDDGKSWVYKRVVLSGFEKMASPVDPDIQLLDDGTFRLYVTSDPNDGQKARTYFADSTDGLQFVSKGVAFARSGQEALDPTVLRVGATWHLYAGGMTSIPEANVHATSTDGATFTFRDEASFAAFGASHAISNGIAVKGGYRLFGFPRTRSKSDAPVIRSFFSTDGAAWTADEGDRLAMDSASGKESGGVKDAAVVALASGKFLMVYVTGIP